MGDWKTCQLGDLITFQRGHDLPKTQMQGGKYPVVGSNGIIGYHNEYTTEAPSITIGRSGNVGKPFLCKGRSWSHNTSLYIKEYKSVDPIFIYYFLQTLDLGNYAGGSAVPTLNRNHIHTLDVAVPADVNEQRQIASVMSALDDKVEKNTKINENLQQQMQALFADWLSANSEYATEVALGDICSKVTDGSHFSPKDDPTSSIPMLSVKDMREFDFDLTSCKHICEDDYDKMVVNDCVPQVNDILVAKDGSYLKEIFICNEQRKLAILSSIAIFRPNTTVIHPEILLAFLKSPRVLQEVRDNYVSGSALPRIVLKDFKKLVLTLPDMDTQKLIAPLFTSIREQIAVNVAQNKYLTQLRDALLPKLMSGELNVDNIQL